MITFGKNNGWRVFALLCLFCVLFAGNVLAQEREFSTDNKEAISMLRGGMKAMDNSDVNRAISYFNRAVKLDAGFVEAHMYLGYIYLKKRDYPHAITWFENAIRISGDLHINNYMLLAEAQVGDHRFDAAIKNLEHYLANEDIGSKQRKSAEYILGNIRFRQEAMNNPVPFKPVNMGSGVNTKDDEYLPAITADGKTLIITRKEPVGDRYRPDYAEDFYVSKNRGGTWTEAKNIGAPINTKYNEGAQCLSPDGRTLYFTGCNRPLGKGLCDIYMSEKVGGKWSRPVNLGYPVNSEEWDSQPSISADGRTLYFASSRKGGKGSSDIWKSVRGADGKWSEPENLSINTAKEEISPCIHPDDRTLYFASNGHPGMGKLDLFVARKPVGGTFGEPTNLGYPINTAKDDACMIVSADGQLGYFASDREDTRGKLDIYSFELYEEARPTAVNYVRGKVTDLETTEPLEAEFELYELETGTLVAAAKSDPINGAFLVTLPKGQEYALSVKKNGYLFYSENFVVDQDESGQSATELEVQLQKLKKDAKIELKNIFFETASFALNPRSQVELKQLAAFLAQNPGFSLQIEGHTDNVGDAGSNQRLSEQRANAVVEYLVSQGAVKANLTAVGYGAAQPRSSNDSEAGRAQNRRIEVRVK